MSAIRGYMPAMGWPRPVDLARAAVGAGLGLGLGELALQLGGGFGLVAPLGASTVLVFAAPNSPLAQPWSVLVGNTVSTLIALALAATMPMGPWVGPLAVALAIAAMMLARALHPPGGAVAFLVAMGMPGGWKAALPVMLIGSVSLVAGGVVWNRLVGRHYPLRQVAAMGVHGTTDASPNARIGLDPVELEGILKDYHQTANIGVADLARLVGAAEEAAAVRRMEGFTCADIMSRDLVTVGPEATLSLVADHFRERGFTSVPVIGVEGALLGVIYQLDLIRKAREDAFHSRQSLIGGFSRMIDDYRSSPLTARDVMQTGVPRVGAETPVGALLRLLADGRTPAVPVVDGARLVGVVTRTDLISALAQRLALG